MNVLELSEQEIVRRQSLQQLRAMGIDLLFRKWYPMVDAFGTTDAILPMKEGVGKAVGLKVFIFLPAIFWV